VIWLASDENFDADIVRGLQRRVPDLDIVSAQDANLSGSSDPTILDWATRENRVLVTHDRDTMPNFVYERLIAGLPMPGVFLVRNRMSKGQAVDELFWAIHCLSEEECKDQIKYFPA
jgi:predicted nuclease of predicted toxin-antitoxin system